MATFRPMTYNQWPGIPRAPRRVWACSPSNGAQARTSSATAASSPARPAPEEPEIAYEFARRTHGNGYATEAAMIVVAEAAATGRCRLWATVRAWNTPSLRVLEKVGFHDSGRITPDPDRGDTIWMTMDLTSGPL